LIRPLARTAGLILAIAVFSAGIENADPRVSIATDLGKIVIAVYAGRAPVTAANFLAYIDRGLFAGASFYRVVSQPELDFGSRRNPDGQGFAASSREWTSSGASQVSRPRARGSRSGCLFSPYRGGIERWTRFAPRPGLSNSMKEFVP